MTQFGLEVIDAWGWRNLWPNKKVFMNQSEGTKYQSLRTESVFMVQIIRIYGSGTRIKFSVRTKENYSTE